MIPELDRKCSECGGSGASRDPEWADWSSRYEATRRLWKDRGYTDETAREQALAVAGPTPEGPEEIPCGVCDGRQRVPTEDGDRLLEFFHRHLWEPFVERIEQRLRAIEGTLDRAEDAAIRETTRDRF